MGDLFHPKVPLAFIHELWGVMEQARHHTFIVLTKRSRRMQWVAELLETSFGVLPNVIGMVTVENQVAANRRIVELLMAPFACRGVSLEPMLGSIDLEAVEVVGGWRINALTGDVMEGSGDEQLPALDGVILGGETGPGARAMRPEWARGVVQQCQAAGVAFTFKRWGDYTPVSDLESWEMAGYQEDEPRGGRVLCGRVWDEFPVSISTAN
jgi:protein gp37